MRLKRMFFPFLLILALTVPSVKAQQATPTGVVTVANRATVGNQGVSVGSTVFSGDLLKTEDEGRLNVQAATVQIALGPNTSVRLFRNLNRVIVEVERGSIAYTAKGTNEDLTIFALDIRIVPKTSVPASGQVTIVSRCDVNVSAIHSTIDVTSGRESRTIEETKSFRVLSEFGVDYRDSWQPVLADYPEYPRDAEYHKSHSHVACPAGVWQASKPPVAPAGSHFVEIVGGALAILTWIGADEAFESAERP
ncbi:MAG TPA: hypothetical protein VEI73_01730 [Candidatus Acidoferrum sp.]|nr:hypothetical protein [Candidatus Acidoferrum sp.]